MKQLVLAKTEAKGKIQTQIQTTSKKFAYENIRLISNILPTCIVWTPFYYRALTFLKNQKEEGSRFSCKNVPGVAGGRVSHIGGLSLSINVWIL